MYELSKKDVIEIFELMDSEVVDRFRISSDASNSTPVLIMEEEFFPEFWIAVATWYCEHENGLCVGTLPDWTPIILAQSSVTIKTESFSSAVRFPGFRLVD